MGHSIHTTDTHSHRERKLLKRQRKREKRARKELRDAKRRAKAQQSGYGGKGLPLSVVPAKTQVPSLPPTPTPTKSGETTQVAVKRRVGKPAGKHSIAYEEDDKKRASRYSKRRNGLLKKASELSIISGCTLIVAVVGDKGTADVYASGTMDIERKLDDQSTPLKSRAIGTTVLTKINGKTTYRKYKGQAKNAGHLKDPDAYLLKRGPGTMRVTLPYNKINKWDCEKAQASNPCASEPVKQPSAHKGSASHANLFSLHPPASLDSSSSSSSEDSL